MIRYLAVLLLCASQLTAQGAKPTVSFGAYLDTYYAYDTGRPETRDRAFTTQAVRHNEFNVNLAHVEAALSGERVRGRLALQAGTAVQANYAGEPTLGVNSGPTVARALEEAYVGVRLAPKLWVDGGVYFSHIGNESWISRDNPTYTRSFTADYTPYYSSGVKLTWSPSSTVTAQLHLTNGWQNISETNSNKALGARVDWTVSTDATLSWSAFLGNERADNLPARQRNFQQVLAKVHATSALTLWGTVDKGWESGDDPTTSWWSATAIGELQLSPKLSLAARVERYVDRDGIIIPVAAANGFDVTSGSLGLNLRLPDGVQWRSEARLFQSGAAIWPKLDGTAKRTTLLVTSLALSM